MLPKNVIELIKNEMEYTNKSMHCCENCASYVGSVCESMGPMGFACHHNPVVPFLVQKTGYCKYHTSNQKVE